MACRHHGGDGAGRAHRVLVCVVLWVGLVWAMANARPRECVCRDTLCCDTAVDAAAARRVRPAREGWEYPLAAPGILLTAPIYLVTRVAAGTAYLVQQSGLERTIKRLLLLPDTTLRLSPSLSWGTGFGLRLTKYGISRPQSSASVGARYGLQNRHAIGLALANGALFGRPIRTVMSMRYRNVPDKNFFGIGPRTVRSDESDYGLQSMLLELSTMFGPTRHLVPSLLLNLHKYYPFSGSDSDEPNVEDVFSPSEAPGLNAEPLLCGAEAALIARSMRNDPRPAPGVWAQVSAGAQTSLNDDAYGFWLGSYEVRLSLGLPRRAHRFLVLRHRGEWMEPFAGHQIPFYLLRVNGNEYSVRGLEKDRFRDKDLFVLTAEYHYQIWLLYNVGMDFFIFTDAGQVGDNIYFGFELGDFQHGYGCGLRLYSPGRLLMSMSGGFTNEGAQFYLSFSLE